MDDECLHLSAAPSIVTAELGSFRRRRDENTQTQLNRENGRQLLSGEKRRLRDGSTAL